MVSVRVRIRCNRQQSGKSSDSDLTLVESMDIAAPTTAWTVAAVLSQGRREPYDAASEGDNMIDLTAQHRLKTYGPHRVFRLDDLREDPSLGETLSESVCITAPQMAHPCGLDLAYTGRS